MQKFLSNRLIILLLGGGLIAILILARQYSEFSFNPTIFYLSVGIFALNLILSGLLFAKASLGSYFLLLSADLILVLNIFLVLGLNK